MKALGAALALALFLAVGCGGDEAGGSSSSGSGGTHQHDGSAGTAALGGTAGSMAGGAGGGGGLGGGAAGGGGGTAGTASVVCELGTMYPNAPIIDPDNPIYEDATHTQAQVTDSFAKAKAENSTAYRGYKAAHDHAQFMNCAFCPCGCATGIGHKSAVDCFKDMHGFTWLTCQNIALRCEELDQKGLSDDEIKATLKKEYPPPWPEAPPGN